MNSTILHKMPPKVLLFISCLFLLTSYKPYANPLYIQVHLSKGDVEHNDTSGMVVFVMGNGKLLAKALSDEDGNFSLSFILHTEKSFDFFVPVWG